MKPKHVRATKLFAMLACIAFGVFIIATTFNDNILFFFSPTDLKERNIQPSSKIIRVGGLVKEGSIKNLSNDTIGFVITDYENELYIEYTGLLPNLFKEKQGTVATGIIVSEGKFLADEILAKHDENYMPKEVSDSLKKNGHWQGDNK